MEFTKSKKIFIVDDDEMIRMELSDYLTLNGKHQVTVFKTGEECLNQLLENPDIIVLDYYLNTVTKEAANGIEILEIIKQNYPHIHVIMLSSQDGYGTAIKTLQKGAEQYVIKDKSAFEKIAALIRELN
jgi:two-component system OmpR family response regulator